MMLLMLASNSESFYFNFMSDGIAGVYHCVGLDVVLKMQPNVELYLGQDLILFHRVVVRTVWWPPTSLRLFSVGFWSFIHKGTNSIIRRF